MSYPMKITSIVRFAFSIVLLLAAVFSFVGSASAQTYSKSYKAAGLGMQAKYVKMLASGKMLVAGSLSATYGNQNLIFMKVDPLTGDTLWARTYASAGSLLSNIVVEEMGNGNLVATAVVSPAGTSVDTTKFLVFATDSLGNALWSKYYVEPVPYAAYTHPAIKMVTPTEFLIWATSSDSIGAVLTKMNLAGDTLFSKAINIDSTFSGNDYQFSDVVNIGDGYLFEGFVRYSEFEEHLLLVKTDTSGNVQWVRSDFHPTTFAVAGYSVFGNDAILTADSNIVIGITGNGLGLLKITRSGSPIWLKMYDDTASYTTFPGYARMTATNDGGFLISGITDEPQYNSNFLTPVGRQLLTKFDSGGNLQWAKTYEMEKNFNICTFAAQLPTGQYVCAGTISDTLVATTVNAARLYVMLLDTAAHSSGFGCGTDSAYSYFSNTNALTIYNVPHKIFKGYGLAAFPITSTPDTLSIADVGLIKDVELLSGTSWACAGTTYVLNAMATNAGTSVNYDFRVNGFSVQSGPSNTLVTTSLGFPDTVTCIMWGIATCGLPDTVVSNKVIPLIYPSATPVVVIHAFPSDTVMAGTTVTFNATVTNGGPTPTYIWKKNFIFETSLPVYTTSSVANGDLIECDVTNNTLCSSAPTGMGNKVIFVKTVAVPVSPSAPAVNLIPNPASSHVFITGGAGDIQVAVHDVTGRTQIPVMVGPRTLDVSSFASGIYFVDVQMDGGKTVFRLEVKR